MIFTSIGFAIFLPVVFLLYWFATKGNFKFQNILLLVSSYFFYGCWDWRFLFLLLFSTSLDFVTGIKIHDAENKNTRKFWFWLSICVNLGFLGVFKYYDFFAASFAVGLSSLGIHVDVWTLNVILPVGISFYTFHGLSYVIDTYNEKIKPERNFINYAVFVSFFPLLVAGPIERATHLLPQIIKKREFDYLKAVDGMRQILWGLFKKMVVADNCAEISNHIFGTYQTQSGSLLFLGAVAFAFQIYGDFSGYSDIAIGTAKLFGIDLLRNFSYPYFSRDIAEFWRRWHISLTSWLKDYLYIPLGGSRGTKAKVIRNTLVIFLVSGFWHGANWTFIAWGGFHALLFLPLILWKTNRKNINIVAEGKRFPGFKELFQILSTFILVTIGWIFFRAETIEKAADYIKRIFSFDTNYFDISSFTDLSSSLSGFTLLFSVLSVMVLILVEWNNRDKSHGFDVSNKKFRWPMYIALCLSIYICQGGSSAFIYFQF
ncbi:MAG: MBOAT family protein [Paludibacter sp.]|nr:MBOAT family protein [Paludibacter sp.]